MRGCSAANILVESQDSSGCYALQQPENRHNHIDVGLQVENEAERRRPGSSPHCWAGRIAITDPSHCSARCPKKRRWLNLEPSPAVFHGTLHQQAYIYRILKAGFGVAGHATCKHSISWSPVLVRTRLSGSVCRYPHTDAIVDGSELAAGPVHCCLSVHRIMVAP